MAFQYGQKFNALVQIVNGQLLKELAEEFEDFAIISIIPPFEVKFKVFVYLERKIVLIAKITNSLALNFRC